MKIGGKQNKQSDFLPCPEGDHPSVLVDIIDLGKVKVSFDGKEKEQDMMRFVFEVHPQGESETYLVFQRYTKSLHEKSTLRKHLKQWRGKDLTTAEEAEGYDVELLLGKPCLLSISHSESKDGANTFANIDLIRPLKGKTCEPAGTYKRPEKYAQYPHVEQTRQEKVAQAAKKPLPNTPENNPAGIEEGPAF